LTSEFVALLAFLGDFLHFISHLLIVLLQVVEVVGVSGIISTVKLSFFLLMGLFVVHEFLLEVIDLLLQMLDSFIMLDLSYFSVVIGQLLSIALLLALRTVLLLLGLVKGILFSLELGFLVLVVVLGLGIGLVFLLDHAFQRLSFASEDIQLLLDVQSLFHRRFELFSPKFSEVFESICELENIVHFG